MSVPDNKALVLRFYEEVWNQGNYGVANEIFAADYVRHDLRPGTAPPGPEGQKVVAKAFRTAFPDARLQPTLLIGEGEYVMARWQITGTNTGEWANIPATGKRVKFAGVNIFRFADGKVVEIWNHRDDLGLMQQVGAPVYAGFPESK